METAFDSVAPSWSTSATLIVDGGSGAPDQESPPLLQLQRGPHCSHNPGRTCAAEWAPYGFDSSMSVPSPLSLLAPYETIILVQT